MNTLTFDVLRFVRTSFRPIVFYFSIILISSMAMIKPAHASGSVNRTSDKSWCAHDQIYNPASCIYSTKEAACDARLVGYPSYNSSFLIWDGGDNTGWWCYAYHNNYPSNFYYAIRFGIIADVRACPSNSTPASATSCTCTDPYVPDATQTGCVKQQYKLSLTPETATIEPGNTYIFTATVTNQDDSPPTEDVPVTVKVEVDPTSGGHDHGGSTRPKGSVSPASGSTALSITFGATEISGTHTITATCELCSNSPLKATINVKVEGLAAIMGSPFYAFIGSNDKHLDNHYLTPQAEAVLRSMAASYQFEQRFILNGDSPHPLTLNDASLVWGGKFDIFGHWTGDHAEHRRGTVIDIRANSLAGTIPSKSFKNFIKLAKDVGANARIHSPGETIQHFHVRLLGRGG